MPLTRYQIRNEYGLADPELYRAADKNDPEALLEGVAMAGLVGVLRQLGDLAEFAAEIFHGLHEEVMATAARGHGLMARVQQLEAEFPSIEKALLSQTDHSAFFTNSGIDWHPNLRSEQGLITRGDLPRFVMDSYEESRGPPRLFLLDKFDVAGAGACLKRYTDPSFFKVEAASGISSVESQREKKIRKVKKKGSRWRNGDNTPTFVPTSHTKLHDLFLEERIENGHPDPARLVKLKRRQLHGSPFDARAGKSYMEKFIETPSPENKAVYEVSVNPLLLKLTSDYSSESGLEVHEISTVSPEKKCSPRKERNLLSPSSEEVVLKPVTNELNLEVIDKGAIAVSDQCADGGETDESPSTIHKMAIEEESAVDVNGKIDGSLDGDHSDGMISEVDNYMDALTTMESEMETDNEYKYKNDQRVLNVGKCGMETDANDEQLDAQANFSDCQSIGNFSLSDDGNGSSKNQKYISSNSGSFANSAENALSDGEVAGKVASTENFQSENADLLSDYPSERVESVGTECHDLVASNGAGMEELKISDLGEASKSSCPENSNPMLQPSVPIEVEEMPFDPVAIGSRSMNAVESATDLDDSSVVTSNVSIQPSNDPLHAVSSESNLVDESDQEDLHMSSATFVHASNVLELDSERKGSNGPMNEETSFNENMGASVTQQPDRSCVVQNAELVSEMDDAISGVVTNSEGLTIIADNMETDIIKEDQSSGVIANISQVEVDTIKMKHEDVSVVVDHEEIVESAGNVACSEGDAVPCEHLSEYLHKAGVDDCRSTDDATETAQTEDAAASTVISSGTNDDGIDNVTYLSLDVTSRNLKDEQESICGPMDPQQRLLENHEAVAPECYIESEAPEEVKQEEVSSKDLDSVPYASVSNPEATKQVCYSPLDSYHQSDSLVSYSTVEPCLEQSQEFKSNSVDQSHSVGAGENDLSSLSCNLPDAETSLNEPMGQVDETSVHVEDPFSDEANCKLLDLQTSSDIDFGKPQILSEQTLDSKYEQPDSGHLQLDEANSRPSNLYEQPDSGHLQLDEANSRSSNLYEQPESGHLQLDEANSRSSNLSAEQMQSLSHMDHGIHVDTSCPEDLSSQKLPLQSTGWEHNDTKLTMNPFDSAFPSLGLLPDATQVNLEMPPLPPLPPMQWRMVKSQFTSQPAERESVGHSHSAFTPMQPFASHEKAQFTSDHCHGTFPPMQACTPDNKDQFCFPMSDTEKIKLSNPFLSAKFTDDGRSQAFSANSVENFLQPTPISLEMPAVISNVNGQHEMGPLEGTQSSNPFLTATEILIEKPEHSSFESQGESVQSNSSAFSAVSSAEDTASGQDHLSHGSPIQSLDQLTHETGFETKVNEHSSQYSEKEQGKSPDKCIESVPTVEEQQQHDLSSSKGESTWLPVTSLGLPPTYEAGKQNGNKLPRPRNPLIDAVAAHDKSKLRKVAERVSAQIGPKVEERDSLLEQIRTKSFNLKPAAVTRPSIQGIQGPKTNLNVAAILEKANAIRQAFAGSDEDEDEDSWSDS